MLGGTLCESLCHRVHRSQFMDSCKQANSVHKNSWRAMRAARSPLCPDMWWTVLAWFWHFFCATAFLLQRNNWGLLLNFSSSRNLLARTPFLMNGVVSSDASGHAAPRGLSFWTAVSRRAQSLFARLLFLFLKKEGKCASPWILSNVWYKPLNAMLHHLKERNGSGVWMQQNV